VSVSLKTWRACEGAALVIVLAFLVLLAGVALAFFSRAMAERQISNSSASQTKVELLAQGALASIVSDLKQEIAAGSVADTSGNPTIYTPNTPANAVPALSGSTGTGGLENLVKRSANSQPFFSGGPTRAANVSSTSASQNGRFISLARWNKPLLLPLNNPGSTTDYTPISAFTPPDWIPVGRDGSNPMVLTTDPTAANYVIGRYAYTIYNEGGLLDVNVAGYPINGSPPYSTANSDPQATYKGILAFADLSQLPGASALSSSKQATLINNLVGWRNYASAQPGGTFSGGYDFSGAPLTNFTTVMLSNTNGFLAVSNTALYKNQSDRMFSGRQELTNFLLRGMLAGAISTPDLPNLQTGLQYLGTFSREVNAPSWSPSTPTGSSIDYAANKDNATSSNRSLPNVRVTTGFARADGTVAQVGESLIKTRFPLSRIGGLGPDGVVTTGTTTMINGALSPATAASVQRDFGLVWNTDHWDYCGPTGTTAVSSIAVIGSIGNPQPNFFELLKAGILSGSLGKDAGLTGSYLVNYEEGPASGSNTQDKNTDCQVIQIGANIIDQYDADSYPTEIRFGNPPTSFYGIENLPYFQRVFSKTLSPDKDASGNDVPKQVGGWYMAEVWNPHQDSGYTPSSTPTQFRFRGEGLVQMYHGSVVGSTNDLKNSGTIEFVTTPTFREPTCLSNDATLLRHSDCTPIDGTNGTNDPYKNRLVVGLRVGFVPNTLDDYGGIAPLGCDLILEYRRSSSAPYRVYDRVKNLRGAQQGSASQVAYYNQRVDPRTDRFGTSVGRWLYATKDENWPGGSLRKDNSPGRAGFDYFPRPSSGFVYSNNLNTPDAAIFQNFFMGTLSDNVVGSNSSNPRYTDPDGVLRSAEGAFYSASGITDGLPLVTGNVPSRPVVLNRPFRNVGELGYAFRDMPWKNIDFFTANSADAGLLDLFCTTEEPAMTAGKTNLNTRQVPALQAIIAGAIKNDGAGTQTYVAASDAAAIATNLVNSSTQPFVNRSDVVNQAAPGLTYSASADNQIKSRREAAVRALGEVGNTRTWNLMIDVVAQTGRYPQSANSLDKFLVEGEKRYWLHVAIDRYTGAVVDKQFESVNE
jgi:hypothetical protein